VTDKRQAGTLVSGRYQLRTRLGQGGYWEVWLAQDQTLGREVAIKFVRSERGERFWQEVQAIEGLDTPYIVTLYQIDPAEQALIMEYVRGGNLRTWFEKQRPNRETWLTLLSQVAQALDALHKRGYLHGDVKPENILIQIDAEGRPSARLADFGLASSTPDLSHGTPDYLAPEQVRCWQNPQECTVDGRADQYALALVAYELLTGHHPFRGESGDVQAKARLRLNHVPPPPRKYEPGLMAFDEPLLQGLADEPPARFESCAALIQALQEAERQTREGLAETTRREMENALRESDLEAARQALDKLRILIQPFTLQDKALEDYLALVETWEEARNHAREARDYWPTLADSERIYPLLKVAQRPQEIWSFRIRQIGVALALAMLIFYLSLRWVLHR